jgi:hypothetical protein
MNLQMLSLLNIIWDIKRASYFFLMIFGSHFALFSWKL